MMDKTCAPVLMLGFNRPELTEGLLRCVRKARPGKLYFAVDGPRPSRKDDSRAVAKVQKIAELVDWPCEVKTLFREKNLGCGFAIPDAISWMLSQEPYGIILEDDVRPSEGFFRYETDLLEKYKDDTRIGLVSGFNHYGFQTNKNESYHFTNRADIWGWGTWARVWKDYSVDIRPLQPYFDEVIEKFSTIRRVREAMRSAIKYVSCENPTTWDFQFGFLIAFKGYLAAAPRKRLTTNVGIGKAQAVHCTTIPYDTTLYTEQWEGDSTLVHPQHVIPDLKAIRLTERRMTGKMSGGLNYLGDKLPRMRMQFYRLGHILERLTPFLFRISW